MVHAVLGGPLPHRTIWNRALPQLTQLEMEAHDVTGQACMSHNEGIFRGGGYQSSAYTLGLHVDLTLCHPRQQGRWPVLTVMSPADAGRTFVSDKSSRS